MPGRAKTFNSSGRSAPGSPTLGRRQGRRSLSAYDARARGTTESIEGGLRGIIAPPRGRWVRVSWRAVEYDVWSAGVALALFYPLLFASHGRSRVGAATTAGPNREAPSMAKKPSVSSLDTVSVNEARAYLSFAGGDELRAAALLAVDRNRLDGSLAPPDETEVHHALFLLCRAFGRLPPSFDEMRVELRRLAAA